MSREYLSTLILLSKRCFARKQSWRRGAGSPIGVVRAQVVSEVGMQSQADVVHGSAVAVVSGIQLELVVRAQPDPLPDVEAIEHLVCAFRSVVEATVAEEETQAAEREVVAMRAAEHVQVGGNSGAIALSAPSLSADQHARGDRPVDLGEHEGLGLAVVPAGAEISADLVGERLLDGYAEPGFRLWPADQ